MASEGIDSAVKGADKIRRKWGAGTRPAHVLFELAGRNNVLVFRLALDSRLSGLFVRCRRHKTSIILVNTTNKNLYHQRFTLAHELGHYRLHEDEDVVIDVAKEGDDDFREHEANIFAAQLLVPLEELRDVLRGYRVEAKDVTDRLIVELAKTFGVSQEVILWRIRLLGGLSPEDTRGRVEGTDWDAAWRRFAPDAYQNTLCAGGGIMWQPEGVSAQTAEQISRLPPVYREMAFEAYQRHQITAGKLAEILGLDSKQAVLGELAPLLLPDQAERDRELANALAGIS